MSLCLYNSFKSTSVSDIKAAVYLEVSIIIKAAYISKVKSLKNNRANELTQEYKQQPSALTFQELQ
jgi:hypothetical protein